MQADWIPPKGARFVFTKDYRFMGNRIKAGWFLVETMQSKQINCLVVYDEKDNDTHTAFSDAFVKEWLNTYLVPIN